MCIAALSISDTVALITHAVHFLPRYALGVTVNHSGVIVCKIMHFLGYTLPCVSQVQRRMVLVVIFCIFEISIVYFVVSIFNLVHDVETTFHLP